jgi:hypothetical protein
MVRHRTDDPRIAAYSPIAANTASAAKNWCQGVRWLGAHMNDTAQVKKDLFHYFESRGVVPGHSVSIEGFTQAMKPSYSQAMLAAIPVAFGELVISGLLESHTSTEYVLTGSGRDQARADRTRQPA